HVRALMLTPTVGTLNEPTPMAVGTATWVMIVVLMLIGRSQALTEKAAGAMRSSSFSIRKRVLVVFMEGSSERLGRNRPVAALATGRTSGGRLPATPGGDRGSGRYPGCTHGWGSSPCACCRIAHTAGERDPRQNCGRTGFPARQSKSDIQRRAAGG